MSPRFFGLILLSLAWLILPVESGRAQVHEIPFDIKVVDWTSDIEFIETLVAEGQLSGSGGEAVRQTLTRVIAEATSSRDQAAVDVAELTAALDALGVPPEGEDAVPESEAVTNERERLNKAIAEAKSQVSLAELTITRAASLSSRLSQVERNRLANRLGHQGPLPYAPATLSEIPDSVTGFFHGLAGIGSRWWQQVRTAPDPNNQFLAVGVFFIFGLGLAWWLRRTVLCQFGPTPVSEPPPYSRRLIATVADGIAKGILPAAVLAVIMLRAQSPTSAIHGEFGTLLGLAAETLMIFVLVTALPHAVLAPSDPHWRLTQMPMENGRRIISLVTPLALLFSIDEFVTRIGGLSPSLADALSEEFLSAWTFAFNLAQGIFALLLLQPSLWRSMGTGVEEPSAIDEELDEDEDDDQRRGPGLFWRSLHIVLLLGVVTGMVAPALGYTNLGNYLLNNMLGTAIVISILYILRGFFREAIGLATGSDLVRDRLSVSHKTRSRLKFLGRFAVDVAIVLLGFSIIAPSWGISETDLLHGLKTVFSGLQIGSVTVSLTDILMGIVVFIASIGLVRMLKRNLAERILPETEIEESLRHSITAGIGYVGFVIATALAIAVAGVDLTNVALIAGALSVGIGFGLQNIVNNFVSGLILLIERPIKVGDWVIVGTSEGFVKQINMRATEIETWNKASVIIPNADLLSQSLTNWTHKDKIGRVDVPVGVALDSDIDKVCAVLLEIAKAHPRCRRFPEPAALVMDIGESRVSLELRLFTSDIQWSFWIASDVQKEILRRFREEGISIPYAQRVIHMASSSNDKT